MFLFHSTEVFPTVIHVYHATVCYLARVDMTEVAQNHNQYFPDDKLMPVELDTIRYINYNYHCYVPGGKLLPGYNNDFVFNLML